MPDEWWGPFAIWKGGLGVWGGIALGVPRRLRASPRRAGADAALLADCLAPGLLVAQGIGRFGNWWNQELFGKPTDLPWGLEIDPEQPSARVPRRARRSIRRSSTRRSGTSPPRRARDPDRAPLPHPAARPLRPLRRRSTASAASGSSCCASTQPTRSPACASTPGSPRSGFVAGHRLVRLLAAPAAPAAPTRSRAAPERCADDGRARRAASDPAARVGAVATAVRDLELDLDAFEGPFDLLLTLVLKEALEPAEIDVAGIVVAFVERPGRAQTSSTSTRAASSSSSIAALLELKARGLFPDEEAELAELEPEEAAEELARRLAEYRRMKEAAAWLRERLEAERDRYFRLGPAPLAPAPGAPPRATGAASRSPRRCEGWRSSRRTCRSRTWRFASRPSRSSSSASAPSSGAAGASTSTPRLPGLSRVEQAVAFLALLELRKAGEIALAQAAPFAPIRVSRHSTSKGAAQWNRPLRLISSNPVDALARTVEALLVVASTPLSVAELADAADDDTERVETALGLLRRALPGGPQRDRAGAGRRRLGLPCRAGGGRRVRPALRAAGRARALAGGARDRWRSSPTSARARARRSRGSAASPPTRPWRRSSSAG